MPPHTRHARHDPLFAGSIPEIYDRLLVPLIFEPYARDLADRVAADAVRSVLEVAAGTGVVTRHLAGRLSDDVSITATDLNQPMVDQAVARGSTRPVQWLAADAMALPFPDDSFDVVVCQFGVMFFPDRSKAYAEIGRVLRPGGRFLFNVWDRIETNEFAQAVTDGMVVAFPQDPPRFLARTPHGYHDASQIRGELADAGFGRNAGLEALEARSVASGPEMTAVAYCQGTPLRNEIEARDPALLSAATNAAAAVVRDRFGSGEVDGLIRGFVIEARSASGSA